jgi:hypothetical protein
MRVVFLSSAYFGYVHTYVFDRSIIDDSAYAFADQARHTGEMAIEARPTPKAGRGWIEQLAAWLSQGKENAPC